MPKTPESVADIGASAKAEMTEAPAEEAVADIVAPAPAEMTNVHAEVIPAGYSKIRVLPRGDGKVATGQYDRITNSFPCHRRGDYLVVPDSVAMAQEENGLAEIVAA